MSRVRQLIPRDRLARVFRSERVRSLVLVIAPAGYGKTSILFQWREALRERGDTAAWVSLDELDSSPIRFLGHLIAAIRAYHPQFGVQALRYLTGVREASLTVPLPGIIEELATLSGRTVLFLDDYHLIESREADQFIDYLLKQIPPSASLVIASRNRPRIDLSALRLRDQLLVIGTDTLKFDRSEVARFLSVSFGRTLPNAELDRLCDRSEGWVAGLQLAGMADSDFSRTDFSDSAPTGSYPHIAEYLAQSVLSQQSREVQEFLLKTSVLQRFNSASCEALTGNEHSEQIIEYLDRSSLFIVSLDERREWHRYHHLFQQFLLATLRRNAPASLPSLYGAAAEWFSRQQLGVEAVEYALLAEDVRTASRMAEEHAMRRILAGHMPEVFQWLARLPKSVWERNPALAGLSCLCLWHMFRQQEAAQMLEHFEEAIERATQSPPQRRGEWRNEARMHRAGIAVCSKRNAEQVLELVDGVESTTMPPFYRAICNNIRGLALAELNRLDMATRHYQMAANYHRLAGSPLGVAVSYYLHAVTCLEFGDLRSVDALLARVPEEPGLGAPAARFIHPSMLECVRGALCFERGEYAEARDLLARNIELAVQIGHLTMVALVYVTLAWLNALHGELAPARRLLEALQELLRKNAANGEALMLADYELLRLCLLSGNVVAAQRIARKYDVRFNGAPPACPRLWDQRQSFAALMWCRARIAQGSPLSALRMLRSLAHRALTSGRKRRYLECRLLEACALRGAGELPRAYESMRVTLNACADERMTSLVLSEGGAATDLLQEMIGDYETCDIDPRFLKRLRGAAQAEAAEPNSDPRQPAGGCRRVSAQLTEREVNVLRLLSLGMPNAAIATRLRVTEHTVKYHLANIYSKLGVKNRTAAVSVARANGLLAMDAETCSPPSQIMTSSGSTT